MKFQLPQTISFIRTCEQAKLPEKSHFGDSGFDLYSAYEYILNPGERVLIDTGLRICLPNGYEAQVRSRSGMALKRGLAVLNSPGTIDNHYTGMLGVILVNHSQGTEKIEVGDRVAQLVIQPVVNATVQEVEDNTDFDSVSRGQDGFGSTGR